VIDLKFKMVKEQFWILRKIWRCRRNIGGAGRKSLSSSFNASLIYTVCYL